MLRAALCIFTLGLHAINAFQAPLRLPKGYQPTELKSTKLFTEGRENKAGASNGKISMEYGYGGIVPYGGYGNDRRGYGGYEGYGRGIGAYGQRSGVGRTWADRYDDSYTYNDYMRQRRNPRYGYGNEYGRGSGVGRNWADRYDDAYGYDDYMRQRRNPRYGYGNEYGYGSY